MWNARVFVLIAALVLLGLESVQAKEFSLKVNGNNFEIVNDSVKVDFDAKRIYLKVLFDDEATVFRAYFHKMQVKMDCLMVTLDEDNVKRVELMSDLFEKDGVKYQFLLNIEVRAGKPYVYIQSSMVNIDGELASPGFVWSWTMKSDEYSADGKEMLKISRPYRKIPFENCIYFPSFKTTKNLALAMDGSPNNLDIYSNINHVERTSSWEKAILGLRINAIKPKTVKRGEAVKLNFIVFSPKDKDDAVAITEKLKSENMFSDVWPVEKH